MPQAKAQLFLLVALLVFYCAGPIIVLVLALMNIGAGGDIENTMLAKVLKAMATDPGAYTGILHQMIVPVVAAVTAANFAELSGVKWAVAWLFLLPLITVFICIINALIFNTVKLIDPADLTTVETGVIGQLFLSTASTLAVYVMLLVGLRIGDQKGVGQ